MISSERVQNVIVVSVIIVAIVSSGFLASNSVYYGASYSLAAGLDVSLVEVKVSNIDHINESINPHVNITFNLVTSSESEGNVRITFMGAALTLNNDTLAYVILSHIPLENEQYVSTDFNNSYTMHDDAVASDKQTILDADASGIWNWEIEYRYSFIVFDEAGTFTMRYLYFNTTTTTIV
ncbi:MAG: hypothetical protein ACTSSE_03645 [Candidatus Thorarchaeota archaeon]